MSYAVQLKDHYAKARNRLGVEIIEVSRLAPVPLALAPREDSHTEPDGVPLDMFAPCSMRFLTTYAALFNGVSVKEILGTSRQKHITAARHHAMTLAYQHTQSSYPTVGRFFKRDHSTVHHALRKRKARGKLVEYVFAPETVRRRERLSYSGEVRDGL